MSVWYAIVLCIVVLAVGAIVFGLWSLTHPKPHAAAERHSWLWRVLPGPVYRALERSSRQWVVECDCGFRHELWQLGAVRLHGSGQSQQLQYCEQCRSTTWHRTRRKTESERSSRLPLASATPDEQLP